MNENPITSGLEPEQTTELGDLYPVEAALQIYEAPEPDQAQLLANLYPFMPGKPMSAPRGWRYWLKLTVMQLSLVNRAFWWASGLMLGLGIVLIFSSEGTFAALFALLSPVLAIVGTAYIFRPEARSLREFELLSAVRPLELLYTRLLLILTYNSVIALTLILLAWSQDAQLVLWRLLLIWLGPMLGLTGVALYTSLRWGAFSGVLAPMTLWASMLFLGWRDAVIQTTSILSPVDVLALAATQSDLLLIASMLTLVVGIILMLRVGHWTTYEAAH